MAKEPTCETAKPELSPRMTLSVPSYSELYCQVLKISSDIVRCSEIKQPFLFTVEGSSGTICRKINKVQLRIGLSRVAQLLTDLELWFIGSLIVGGPLIVVAVPVA